MLHMKNYQKMNEEDRGYSDTSVLLGKEQQSEQTVSVVDCYLVFFGV